MTHPGAFPPVCPFLGLADDPQTHFAFPELGQVCHAGERPTPIDLGWQASYCLGENFSQCKRFMARAQQDLPAKQELPTAPLAATSAEPVPRTEAPAPRWPTPEPPAPESPALAIPAPHIPASLNVTPRRSLPERRPLQQRAPRREGPNRVLLGLGGVLGVLALMAAVALVGGWQPGIAQPSATPRPSASLPIGGVISPTPSATPTLGPTLSPSPIPSPTATPTQGPSPTPSAAPLSYTVQRGDTLQSIAIAFGVKWRDIATANNLVEPYRIHIGQVLIIPQ